MDGYTYWANFLLGLQMQEMPFREPRSNGREISESALSALRPREQERAMTDTAILEYILGDVDPLLRPKPNKVPVYCTLSLFIMFFGIVCFGLFLLLRDKRFEDLGKAIFF